MAFFLRQLDKRISTVGTSMTFVMLSDVTSLSGLVPLRLRSLPYLNVKLSRQFNYLRPP